MFTLTGKGNGSIKHSVHRGINPTPQKKTPPLSCQASPLKFATVQVTFLGNPPSILVFREKSNYVLS